MSGLIEFFPQVFTVESLIVLVAAVIGGLIMGALPGISPSLAVALLVPFTFWMEPASGLIMLGAVYASAVAGGAVSAILINVPGAPADIATLFDGYPMSRQGRSQKALYLCFISTFIGGTFGLLVLVLLTPPLANFALKFGATEMFWVAMFGITVMASLATGSLAKGLIAGAFGLLLGTIGMSPTEPVERFVFTDNLRGGIHIISALIGLFAIPQVFALIEGIGAKRAQVQFQPEKGIFWSTVWENLKKVKTLAIGVTVGSIVGIIPGAGGQIAGIVSYDYNRRFSKNPETFGTGNPEGVIASQASNSAMVGPSLIPLLTLGIPGSPTAAVLLGGLLINGLFPGPDILDRWASVTYTFMAGLLLAQVVLLGFGIVLSRYSHWITNISHPFMAAGIVVLAVIGTYSIQTNFDDVVIMFGLGFMMFIALKAGFPAAPMVLGVILGPIAENNFAVSRVIAETQSGSWNYFFTGSINVVLVILCLVSVGLGLFMAVRSSASRDRAGQNRLLGLVSGAVPLLVAGAMYLSLRSVSNYEATLFPKMLLAAMASFALVLLVTAFRRGKPSAEITEREKYPFAKIGVMIAGIVIYLVGIQYVGFYVTSFLFFSITPVVVARNVRITVTLGLRNMAVAAGFVGALYLLFNEVFHVLTPEGFAL